MENVEEVFGPVGVPIPDKREDNSPKKSAQASKDDLKKVINTEIYNNMRFYMKMLYENAATETDVILLKALWREIKRMMRINGIEVEDKGE
ncbi:hypothetical protein E3E23_00605 [Thermococcus sp. CX2]|uniref:hypothetical protein n=1 Tax=Thermococcus sp. CX2 TaxID=163006 RepID=UPI001439A1F5|nr:hypothetical protein [Thermococcus sp. CX2]NJE84347.1 hypothetical protein [Thermococcus sp. CX2]